MKKHNFILMTITRGNALMKHLSFYHNDAIHQGS